MKKDCPKLNNDKKKNRYENFKKKKAFKVTWDDSDSSSSESDSDSDEEQANVCFMAQTDEVCPDLSYEDLLELIMELDDKFRKMKKLNKDHIAKINRLELEVGMLKDEKIILEEELELSQEKN